MLSECFARSADVATANAVVQIIPSPPLSIPSSEGTFCHVRCALRVEPAGGSVQKNSIAARIQVRFILAVPGNMNTISG